MTKKYYYKTKEAFSTDRLNGSIPNDAIVFIEDSGQIYTHGHFFGGQLMYVGDEVKDVLMLDFVTYAQLEESQRRLDLSTKHDYLVYVQSNIPASSTTWSSNNYYDKIDVDRKIAELSRAIAQIDSGGITPSTIGVTQLRNLLDAYYVLKENLDVINNTILTQDRLVELIDSRIAQQLDTPTPGPSYTTHTYTFSVSADTSTVNALNSNITKNINYTLLDETQTSAVPTYVRYSINNGSWQLKSNISAGQFSILIPGTQGSYTVRFLAIVAGNTVDSLNTLTFNVQGSSEPQGSYSAVVSLSKTSGYYTNANHSASLSARLQDRVLGTYAIPDSAYYVFSGSSELHAIDLIAPSVVIPGSLQSDGSSKTTTFTVYLVKDGITYSSSELSYTVQPNTYVFSSSTPNSQNRTYTGSTFSETINYSVSKNGSTDWQATKITRSIDGGVALTELTVLSSGTLNETIPASVGTHTIEITLHFGAEHVSKTFTYIVSQQGQEPEQHTYTLTVSGGTTLNYTGEVFAAQTIMYVMKMDGATVQPSSVQYRRGTSGSWTSVSSPLTGSFTVEVPAGSTTSNTSYVYYVQATYNGNTQTGSTTFVVNKPYTPSYSLSATGGTTLEYTGSVVQRTITYTMREDGTVVTPDTLTCRMGGNDIPVSTPYNGSFVVDVPAASGSYIYILTATYGNSGNKTASVTIKVNAEEEKVYAGMNSSATIAGVDKSQMSNKPATASSYKFTVQNTQNGVYLWIIVPNSFVPSDEDGLLEVATDKNYMWTVDMVLTGQSNGYKYWRSERTLDAVIQDGEYVTMTYYIR